MNNINGINGYGGPSAIRPPYPEGTPPGRSSAAPAAEQSDQVEISPIAHWLQKIALLPEIRRDKVEAVRQALAEGTYDVEGKLSIALDRLLEEYMQE